MAIDDFIAENTQYVFNTYGRYPVMLVEGRGSRVRDSNGREYLDCIGGLAACILGHGHERLSAAICEQAKRLIHVSNLFYIEPQIRLARELTEVSFADKAFFCNSGAEANEGAIKLARRHFHDRGEHERYHVITMDGSFHGRTLATLAATGQTKYRAGFDPMMAGFSHVPFNDFSALEAAIANTTAAVMLEPIQGEGGVRVPATDYLPRVRELCDRSGCLLILDEVQTGMGRTGTMFAYEQSGIRPDIMTLAKGIAGGVPMGVMLATDEVARVLVPGTHASTFGGNPLAAAAGLAVMHELRSPGFLDRVGECGRRLRMRLEELATRHTLIKEVRGLGLMQAIELNVPGADFVGRLRERGVLVNCTAETVLRFLPPLIITDEEIDELAAALDYVFETGKDG